MEKDKSNDIGTNRGSVHATCTFGLHVVKDYPHTASQVYSDITGEHNLGLQNP